MIRFALLSVVIWLESSLVLDGYAADKQMPEKYGTIPLSTVWAWNMPGTLDIRSLEPQFFGVPIKTATLVEQASHSLTSQILEPLSKAATERPEPAFAVEGIGLDALENAHAVLAKGEEPTKSLSTSDDVSIVFFSHESGTYVHLQQVTRQNNRIEIRYEFVPHADAELTHHLALIPLGKLPPGKYKTRIVLAPLDKKYAALADESMLKELASRSVCGSFQFAVHEVPQGE